MNDKAYELQVREMESFIREIRRKKDNAIELSPTEKDKIEEVISTIRRW